MFTGTGGNIGADTGKAPAADARQADAARHDGGGGGKSRPTAGGGPKTPPRKTPADREEDAGQAAAEAAAQLGDAADRQANGATPNGSGGVMTSGQRLLAAQSGASTLDPRRSDD